MVNCFLLMVSALRGVPPVSLQPGKQLCRHSSAADGGLSLGPPSRKPLKSLGRSSTLRPPLFLAPPSNRDIGKHLLSQSGRKIVDASWTTLTEGNTMKTLVSMLALAVVMAFSAPAFAAPKTQAACERAGMHWDQTAKKCSKGM